MQIFPEFRSGVKILEHARVDVESGQLGYIRNRSATAKLHNIPAKNTAAVILGRGCALTHAAANVLAAYDIVVGFATSADSIRFMTPPSRKGRAQSWAAWWIDPEERITRSQEALIGRADLVEQIWEEDPFDIDAEPDHATKKFRQQIKRASSEDDLRSACAKLRSSLIDEAQGALGIGSEGGRASEVGDAWTENMLQGTLITRALAASTVYGLGIPDEFGFMSNGSQEGLTHELSDFLIDAYVIPSACAQVAGEIDSFDDTLVETLGYMEALSSLYDVVRKAERAGA